MNLQSSLAEYPRLLANSEVPDLLHRLKDRRRPAGSISSTAKLRVIDGRV